MEPQNGIGTGSLLKYTNKRPKRVNHVKYDEEVCLNSPESCATTTKQILGHFSVNSSHLTQCRDKIGTVEYIKGHTKKEKSYLPRHTSRKLFFPKTFSRSRGGLEVVSGSQKSGIRRPSSERAFFHHCMRAGAVECYPHCRPCHCPPPFCRGAGKHAICSPSRTSTIGGHAPIKTDAPQFGIQPPLTSSLVTKHMRIVPRYLRLPLNSFCEVTWVQEL